MMDSPPYKIGRTFCYDGARTLMFACETYVIRFGSSRRIRNAMSRERKGRILLWLIASLCVCTMEVAQQRTASPPSRYGYQRWTAENGLPQSGIRGIAQTPDGYLWFATLDGLARFDGVRFTVFNRSNTPGIASNFFNAMVRGEQGDLWLSDLGGGLTRMHAGAFHTFTSADGLPTSSVRGITTDTQGHVWVLSEERILAWNQTTSEFEDMRPQELRTAYRPQAWNNAGFWGLDGSRLSVFNNGRFTERTLPVTAAMPLLSVGIDAGGALWTEASDNKLFLFEKDGSAAHEVNDSNLRIRILGAQGDGGPLLVVGPGLSRILQFASGQGAGRVPLTCLFKDRDGNVWIGTDRSGLYEVQPQTIHMLSRPQGLASGNMSAVLQGSDGVMWLGSWDAGLSRYDGKAIRNFGREHGLPSMAITGLMNDRHGRLWVGAGNDIGMFRDGLMRKPYGIRLPEHAVVQAILQDRGGTLWIGTSSGLEFFRDGPERFLTSQDGLATDDVRALIETPAGDLWIGGYGGLTRIHDGQFSHWTERDGLPSNNVRSLYFDSDGVLWIGTYDGGLGRYKDGHFQRFREEDGLFNNGVFQILEDSRGNLWMSSNRGIYRVSKRELNDFAAGSTSSVTSVAYGKADGLENIECNGGVWPPGVRARDGKLWFPTQDGVAIANPEIVRQTAAPPPVLIEQVVVDGLAHPVNVPLQIAPGEHNVNIEYTALNFTRPEQTRFRYKLEGVDADWTEAGTRRTAYFTHLPSGTFTFRVVARNSEGVWSDAGASLKLHVLPPLYRTWWFYSLEVLAVAGTLGGVARFRLLQFRKVQAFSQQLLSSQEAERQRIAAELHDSLGQHLVVINNLALFSLRAQGNSNDGRPSSGLLQEISEEAACAIRETREISYNLRPFQLDRLGLTKAVEAVVNSTATASGVSIACSLDNIDDAFAQDVRIHFYRIVQECLNNMMRHAKATEAQVHVMRNQNSVLLIIRDNGVGIQPGIASTVSKTGFGMTGLRQRAQALHGDIRTISAPGAGTELRFDFPVEGVPHD